MAISYFLRPHLGLYAGIFSIILISSVFEMLTAASLFPFASALLGEEQPEGGGAFLSFLTRIVSYVPIQDKVMAPIAFLLVVVVLKGFSVLLREALIAHGCSQIVYDAKTTFLNKLSSAPFCYFLANKDGDLSYRISGATQSLGTALVLLPYAGLQVFTIFAITILLATISWKLTLVVAGVGMGVYGIIRYVSRKVSFLLGKGRADALEKELGLAMQFIRGAREIFVAQSASRWTNFFERECNRFRLLSRRDMVWQAIPGVFMEMSFFFLLASVVGIFIFLLEENPQTTLSTMVVFGFALYRLVGASSIFSRYKLRISSLMADINLLYEAISSIPQEIENSEDQFTSLEQGLSLENISFSYSGRSTQVLINIDCEIPKGKVTAIVGPSGSGKSTLVYILTRLLMPSEGTILVDGKNLDHINRSSWLRVIGYVGQDPFIFDGTIEENIKFGLEDVTALDIQGAAKVAQAHDFIQSFPDQYLTRVGERGTSLSGGQRQRVAIARAILRKPEIFIFDEATSALDSASEGLVQKAIIEIARDHTVIIVAHRISTIRMADHIIVLDQGKIIEQGKHEELLALKGYYNLVQMMGEGK